MPLFCFLLPVNNVSFKETCAVYFSLQRKVAKETKKHKRVLVLELSIYDPLLKKSSLFFSIFTFIFDKGIERPSCE